MIIHNIYRDYGRKEWTNIRTQYKYNKKKVWTNIVIIREYIAPVRDVIYPSALSSPPRSIILFIQKGAAAGVEINGETASALSSLWFARSRTFDARANVGASGVDARAGKVFEQDVIFSGNFIRIVLGNEF